jgi:hypothetical protein
LLNPEVIVIELIAAVLDNKPAVNAAMAVVPLFSDTESEEILLKLELV